ncbi:universal stress protein [Persicitalea jodogahamensis]|nr:universal stress protein [Persicitalea jodogahamensis]
MKNIIVPTDLSAATDIALSVAADIAQAQNATVLLLHMVVQPIRSFAYTGTGSTAPDDLVRRYYDANKEAEAAIAKLVAQEKYRDKDIKYLLVEDSEGLIKELTEREADLIVMHTRGSSGWEEFLLGSNAEAIVRNATCPVLVVRERVENFKPEKVVRALDLDERMKARYDYPFPLSNQEVPQWLYVMTPDNSRVPDGIRNWVHTFATEHGIDEYKFNIHEAKTVPEGIIEYAEDNGADLIVLYTHGRKGLRHLFAGSVAEDVLNHSKIPVLVMRL